MKNIHPLAQISIGHAPFRHELYWTLNQLDTEPIQHSRVALGYPDVRFYIRMCLYFVSNVLVSVVFTKCPFFYIFVQFYLKMEGTESGVEFFRTLGLGKRFYILEKRIQSESHWHRMSTFILLIMQSTMV